MMEFKEWTRKEKGIGMKSAFDVASRLKRARTILGTENIDDSTIVKLESNEIFQRLSMTVKSQLRRSIRLYIEYQKQTP